MAGPFLKIKLHEFKLKPIPACIKAQNGLRERMRVSALGLGRKMPRSEDYDRDVNGVIMGRNLRAGI